LFQRCGKGQHQVVRPAACQAADGPFDRELTRQEGAMEKAHTPDDDQAPEEEAAQTGSPRLSDADRAKDKEREMEESGQELPG
jgi:hypothetical protein